jgi:hypothetical protein
MTDVFKRAGKWVRVAGIASLAVAGLAGRADADCHRVGRCDVCLEQPYYNGSRKVVKGLEHMILPGPVWVVYRRDGSAYLGSYFEDRAFADRMARRASDDGQCHPAATVGPPELGTNLLADRPYLTSRLLWEVAPDTILRYRAPLAMTVAGRSAGGTTFGSTFRDGEQLWYSYLGVNGERKRCELFLTVQPGQEQDFRRELRMTNTHASGWVNEETWESAGWVQFLVEEVSREHAAEKDYFGVNWKGKLSLVGTDPRRGRDATLFCKSGFYSGLVRGAMTLQNVLNQFGKAELFVPASEASYSVVEHQRGACPLKGSALEGAHPDSDTLSFMRLADGNVRVFVEKDWGSHPVSVATERCEGQRGCGSLDEFKRERGVCR